MYQLDKTFYFLILRAKFKNQAMLFIKTFIELSDTDIGFKTIFCLPDEMAVMKKNGIFSTSTQILE